MVTFRLQFPGCCRILIFDDMALFRMPQKYATDDSIVYIDWIRKENQNLENVKRREVLEFQKRRIIEYAIQNGKITKKETEKLIGKKMYQVNRNGIQIRQS